MTGRKPEGASSESESDPEDGAGKSPGKKVISAMATFDAWKYSVKQNYDLIIVIDVYLFCSVHQFVRIEPVSFSS